MKNLGNLAVLLFMLCACTSCNNDDDNTKPELAQKVAGTYNGDIELSVQEASQGTKGVEISVNRIAEDTVDVTFPAISFGSRQSSFEQQWKLLPHRNSFCKGRRYQHYRKL